MFGHLFKSMFTIVIIIALVAGFFVVKDVQDINVEDFSVTSIKDVTSEGFTVTGTIKVSNPSMISFPIADLPFTVTLHETGELIGSGVIPAFTLQSKDTTTANFEQNIEWKAATSTLLQVLLDDQVFIDTEGVFSVNIPVISGVEIKFSDSVDIKEQMAQMNS